MIFRLPSLVLCFFLAVLGACGTSHSNTGSETHWLEVCNSDSQCGELSCQCGVCTRSCDAVSQCGSMGMCASPGSAEVSDRCGSSTPSRGLCLPRLTDSGSTEVDAGSTDGDAGSTDVDAGSTDVDAGSTDVDAGSTDVDAAQVDAGLDAGRRDAGSMSGCRDESDCNTAMFEYCATPGSVQCGVPPMDMCDSSDDCLGELVCFPARHGCEGTHCGERCSDCDLDHEVCNAEGICEPLHCEDDDYSCPVGTICDPETAGPGTSGCVRTACTRDFDCPGFCVQGLCYPELGYCTQPAA